MVNDRDRNGRHRKGSHEPSGKKDDRCDLKKYQSYREALFRNAIEKTGEVQKNQAPREKRGRGKGIAQKKQRHALTGQSQHGTVPHDAVFL